MCSSFWWYTYREKRHCKKQLLTKSLGKKIIAVQLNLLYEYPEELKNCGAIRVYSFNHADIVKAVRGG